jgi:hypothetical protein
MARRSIDKKDVLGGVIQKGKRKINAAEQLKMTKKLTQGFSIYAKKPRKEQTDERFKMFKL